MNDLAEYLGFKLKEVEDDVNVKETIRDMRKNKDDFLNFLNSTGLSNKEIINLLNILCFVGCVKIKEYCRKQKAQNKSKDTEININAPKNLLICDFQPMNNA